MTQMKVVRYYPPGGPEKFKVQDEPIPTELREDEVLIKVHAVGLIWSELTWPIYKNDKGEWVSHIPGHDYSGVIVRVGSGVQRSDLTPGTEVFVFISFTAGRAHEGGMAEYAVADEGQVMPKPKSLDFVQAAAVPLSALTAWQALFDHGKLQKGQRVLITSAAGGTGVFAVQFARRIGAYVIGTGASAESRKICEDLGVDKFVNYKTEDLKTAVGEVDLVLDCVGGKTLEEEFTIIKSGGIVVSIKEYNCKAIAEKKGVTGVFFIVGMDVKELGTISELIDSGEVKVFVDKTFPLEKAREAFEDSELGRIHGKNVIKVVD